MPKLEPHFAATPLPTQESPTFFSCCSKIEGPLKKYDEATSHKEVKFQYKAIIGPMTVKIFEEPLIPGNSWRSVVGAQLHLQLRR